MKISNIRKRGADMTQALLYAAFALLVLIGVLAMYSVVTTSNNKTTSARTISTVAQETRTLFRNSTSFAGLTNQILIDSGSVPTDSIDVSRITLPYAGYIDVREHGASAEKFEITIGTPLTRGGRALCTFLTSGDKGEVISGPLGAEYTVPADADCGSPGPDVTDALTTIVYER